MNYYEVLQQSAEPVSLEPSGTSYFSVPNTGLDPRLFRNAQLDSNIRQSILGILLRHLNLRYQNVEAWMNAWLAGSAVSTQWASQRTPTDLDCLVGIDYIGFRQSNPAYAGYSDKEIADTLNEGFRLDIHPETDNFLGQFELTFYVNVKSNIVDIKPYAAYSLISNTWTVPPIVAGAPNNPDWEKIAEQDKQDAIKIIKRYGDALEKVQNAKNDAMRINAQSVLQNAVEQGAALYDSIHEARKIAFSDQGEGYLDFNNYRWQAGKRSGAIQALRKLSTISKDAKSLFATETYGVELPSANTLIRRAAESAAKLR